MALCNSNVCSCAFQSSTISITGNGSPENPYVLEFSASGLYLPLAGGVMDPGAQIDFGFNLGQHIIMFNTTADYGFGMQTSTMYSRVNTGGEYAWYEGGVHSDTALDPGAGGSLRMVLGEARFGLYAATSTFWSTVSYMPVATAADGLSPLGSLTSMGSSNVDLVSNGYRNSGGSWTSLGVGGLAGVSMLSLRPNGDIIFSGQNTTPAGTSVTERARILGSSGLVLVGKAATGVGSAGHELQQDGEQWSTVGAAGDINHLFNKVSTADANGQVFVSLRSANTVIGTITRATASSVAYNTTSDAELKNIRGVLDPELARWILHVVVPKLFSYLTEPDVQLAGYIAQEVAAAWPGAVDVGLVTPGHGDINLRTWDEHGQETTNRADWESWKMDKSYMIPVLHAVLSEVDDDVAALKETVAAIVKVPVIAAALKK